MQVGSMIVNIQEWDREALNELLAQAEIYAKRGLTEKGEIAPTLFMHGADDTAMLRAQGLTDDRSKDKFAATARLMCLAHAANATVFVSEGWMSVGKPGEGLDMSKPPSQRADRQEILMIMGETRFESSTKLLPMLRSDAGKFLGFGEPRDLGDRVVGRFAHLLPENHPSIEQQRAAKELLHVVAREASPRREQERGYER